MVTMKQLQSVKVNDLSFWFGVDRLENESQSMQFPLSNRVTSTSGFAGGTVVTGAYQDKNNQNADRVIFSATGMEHSKQTNVKFKATYDITPSIKVTYTLGIWDAASRTDIQSYIKDAAGNDVYNGRVRFNGLRYDIAGMSPSEAEALHIMQAIDLKSNTKGFFDWELTLV